MKQLIISSLSGVLDYYFVADQGDQTLGQIAESSKSGLPDGINKLPMREFERAKAFNISVKTGLQFFAPESILSEKDKNQYMDDLLQVNMLSQTEGVEMDLFCKASLPFWEIVENPRPWYEDSKLPFFMQVAGRVESVSEIDSEG